MVLGAALILGALTLFLCNRQEEVAAEEHTAILLPQLVQQVTQASEYREPEIEVPAELLEPEDLVMTEMIIEGNPYIGYLSIPTLGLELPIMSDWSYSKLQISPCRYYGSLRGDDLVLMAHNYERHFGGISRLDEGDLVIFTDMDGGVTEYEVVAQDVLDPYSVGEMVAGDFDLTLFTCTYGGASRVTVYCDRVKHN